MKTNIFSAVIAVLGAISTGQAGAATFEYRTVVTYPDSAPRSCFNVDSSISSSATATCASPNGNVVATASSGPDGLKAGSKVTGASDDGKNNARATALLFDELTFGVDSGIFRLGVNVSGSINLVSNNSIADGGVGLSLGSTTTTGVRTNYDAFVREAVFLPGSGLLVPNAIGDFGMNFIDIAFTEGFIDFDARLSTFARCQIFVGTVCTADFNFLSTAVFAGGSVFDSVGNILGGVSVTSASGIDYLASVNGPSPVPLPASLPLLAAGLGGLGFIARRKRKGEVSKWGGDHP